MRAPHKLEIMQAPSAAPGFAELAFRAGETAVAREVLATFTPEVDQQLHDWALTMGWVMGHVEEKALAELRATIVKARELHDAMLRTTGPAQLQAGCGHGCDDAIGERVAASVQAQ